MKALLVIAVATLSAASWYGCCRGCGKGLNTDLIPGMKDSGIPDPHAVKEHSAEMEKLGKQINELAEEQQKIATDPTLGPEEKQRRLEEVQKKMEPLVERMAEIGGDITNKETEVNKDIDRWKRESGGK